MYPVGVELANTWHESAPADCSLSQIRSCLERMGYKCNDNSVLQGAKDAWVAAWRIRKDEEIHEENEENYVTEYYYEDYPNLGDGFLDD
jgi:hypothetical protein